MSDATDRLDTEEVARRLGVKRETVYAYVSRGLLVRHPASGPHHSEFDPEEVERLADQVAMLDAGRLRLNETTESLQGRFRRVEVTGAATNAMPAPGWLEWERAGALTRFVETRYGGEPTERAWREQFAGAELKAQPMTLREIFMTLARANRATNVEASA